MKKGDVIEAEILRLDFPNKGVAEAEDRESGERIRLRVKGVLPGERVRCRITRNGRDRKEARLLEVIRPGEMETEIPCPHFSICGGCSYQTLSADAELSLKEAQVRRLLEPVLARQDEPYQWEEALDSPLRYGYRNKMEFTFGDSVKDGPLSVGLHRRGSMYDIESVTSCKIVDEDYRKILQAVIDVFTPLYASGKISFYHRMTGEGFLRHLLIRKAAHTGEILADLVTTSQTVQKTALQAFAQALLALELEGRIVGILHTINDSRADVVRDEGTEILYGQDHFYEELLGLRFRITPFSFFQTNSHSAEVLYRKVREYVRLALDDSEIRPVVYDLYSGTGTIAQIVASVADRVAGIEIVPEAVEAAILNAKENRITNCTFFAGDVLKLVDDPALSETVGKPDLIILDPPREGIHPKALPKLLSFGVEHIIYVSCKPTSLATDLAAFIQNGYAVRRLCVLNQFPAAVHVETVALLSKLSEAKHHIEVKVDMDELDLTSAEAKATYEEIRNWVQEKYGLHVTNLNIAQVKQKHGIIERENYNKPKSENSKQPGCPEEKIKAIEDAMQHFQMI
ncbi:MAG: 23S rRNA (uracil(1939)-C(5))-methyltransferase RlmD [Lachnospiraceae bacterium]|nr:23S rRNA (uracil(1939)-C(5))-methyltransferase RlmD [Lachnospiraceae bacterium]